jgi:hypothetical protein
VRETRCLESQEKGVKGGLLPLMGDVSTRRQDCQRVEPKAAQNINRLINNHLALSSTLVQSLMKTSRADLTSDSWSPGFRVLCWVNARYRSRETLPSEISVMLHIEASKLYDDKSLLRGITLNGDVNVPDLLSVELTFRVSSPSTVNKATQHLEQVT